MILRDSADHLTRGATLSSEMTICLCFLFLCDLLAGDGMQSGLFLLQSTCHHLGLPALLNTLHLEDSIPVSAHWY